MTTELRAIVLCYHSANISGNDYHNNDHIALECDLRTLLRREFLIVSLKKLADVVIGGEIPAHWSGRRLVALSCDDGTNYDFYDYEHERWGYQRSFYAILSDADVSNASCDGEVIEMTSFVIASPEDRAIMDKTSMAGLNRWTDEWWCDAVRSKHFLIGNHSWDHCSVSLPRIAQRDQRKGTFMGVDRFGDAEKQIARASEYISRRCPNVGSQLFAYPYGEVPEYLVSDYFPTLGRHVGVHAAYATGNQYVTFSANRWAIPRFVCGDAWCSEAQFAAIIDDLV